MRKISFWMMIMSIVSMILISCSDNDDPPQRIIPTMSLEVTEIADNTALITSELLTGEAVSAKVINFFPISDVGFDYNVEVRLVKFVEENGEAAELPYTKRLETRLRPGVDYISAIIAYNKEGRAVCSAFQTWKATGTEGMWSEDNSAGELEENEW